MKRIIHFSKIAILGLEGLGAAIGLSVKRLGVADHVTGIMDRPDDITERIGDSRAVDDMTSDLEKGICESDLIILNLTGGEIIEILPQIASLAKPGCIVTDTYPIKKDIVECADAVFDKERFFIGSHPMFYEEQCDLAQADGAGFQNKTAFVTYLSKTDRTALVQVSLFWKALGALPFLIEPERHDQYMALTSQLPVLTSSALIRMISEIPENDNFIREITGAEFSGATSFPIGNASFWAKILKENSIHVLPQIDRMISKLQTLKKCMESGDSDELRGFLSSVSNFQKSRRVSHEK